ncbi:DUF6617 family protein [Roseivirga seohaensis]|uniref:DUF6617 family protein n=1 Tax=Roseivirga seohaensis TaxID=1914963 RepID=UPI003BA9077B
MSQYLTQIRELLFREYRPWMMESYSEAKFKQLLNAIKTPAEKVAPHFAIEFDRPITFKRKFFVELINADAIEFLNEIHTAVRRSESTNHKKFQVYNALNKSIKDLLIATNNTLSERELDESLFKPVNGKIRKGNDADEAFIFHYLKHQLIRLYLEISEAYPSYRKSENLELEDLYETHFSETAPVQPVIIPQIEIDTTSKENETSADESPQALESFLYVHIDTDPDNLNNACDSLRLNGFIDKSTTVPQFKRLFSGKEVNNPVVWTGTPSDLYYLIAQIHNKHKLVKNMKQKQWKVACQCFVKPDGSLFEYKAIRVLKRPASTGDKLDKAIQLLI